MIDKLIQHLQAFQRNEDGVTAIEYGVLIALISGSLLFTLPLVGSGISNPMSELAYAIDGGGASSGDDSEGESDSDDESDDDDDHDDDDDDDGGSEYS